jgi:choice-of-anchor A domain-containing protein
VSNIFKTFGIIGAISAIQVSAGFVDITQGYNVVTFGGFYDHNDQIHGKVAVGGHAIIENSFGVNVDASLTDKAAAIVSGGNVTVAGNGEVHGSIYAQGNVLVNSATVTGDVYAKNIAMQNYDIRGTMYYTNSVSTPYGSTQKISSLPTSMVDFASTQNAAINLSNQLSSTGSDDFSITSGTLYLDDQAGDVNCYTIAGSDLSTITSLHFEDLSEQYIINVDGKGGSIKLNNINQKNYGTSNDFNFSNVLFNFVNTTSLEVGSFYGNILAAETDVTAKDGQMYGSFVANSFSGKYEFHNIIPGDFNPPQDVPEPTSLSLMLVGLTSLGGALFMRKRK